MKKFFVLSVLAFAFENVFAQIEVDDIKIYNSSNFDDIVRIFTSELESTPLLYDNKNDEDGFDFLEGDKEDDDGHYRSATWIVSDESPVIKLVLAKYESKSESEFSLSLNYILSDLDKEQSESLFYEVNKEVVKEMGSEGKFSKYGDTLEYNWRTPGYTRTLKLELCEPTDLGFILDDYWEITDEKRSLK